MGKKDKKEKKGLFGRFFGGKKDDQAKDEARDDGESPATPEADAVSPEDAATIPPGAPVTPGGEFSPDAATIESNDPGADAATIPPGYMKGGKGKKGGAPRTPVAPAEDGDEGAGELTMAPAYAKGGRKPSTPPSTPPASFDADLTMPPGYAQKKPPATPVGGGDLDVTMPPGYVMGGPGVGGPGAPGGDDFGELTMAPAYAQRGPGGAPATPGGEAADMLTMPPGYANAPGPASEMTMAPAYARPGSDLGDDPFARQQGGGDQDMILTNDPDLQPVPRAPASDPFGFGPEDPFMGGAPGAAPVPATPPAAAGKGPKRKPTETFGFGEDVVDLLAPTPGGPPGAATAAVTPAVDPFGAPLTDDPYDGAAAPPPPAPPRPAGHKTEPLEAASGIDTFDIDLGAEGHGAANAPTRPAPASTEPFQEEVTLELDRPVPAAGGPKGFQARATNRLPEGAAASLAEETAAPEDGGSPPRSALTEAVIEVPSTPVQRTLFATSEHTADGGRRLSGRAAEATLDEKTGVLHAPPVPGGWSEVPAFAAVLADGSVVGRLPRTARVEGDAVVLPPAPPARAWEPDAAGRKAPPFPAGVVVDRATRVAYASPDVAPALAGSPEKRIRTEDGGLVLFVPEGATFDDAGGYTAPAEPAPAATAAAPATPASPGEGHPAHGALVLRASYLGCEELVYADGWSSVRLAPGAKVERDHVVLPASCRAAPGTPPALLEIGSRPDGSVVLPIPEGFLPEGDLVWIAPVASAEPDLEPDASWTEAWGEPVERLAYAGIEDSLYANGWVRLDLPAGAVVSGRRVQLPREYAHACDAARLVGFDREPDGRLAFELPEAAEVLGSVVLLPPVEGGDAPPPAPEAPPARAAAAPAPAPSQPAPASSDVGSGGFRSAAPPDGGDVVRPGTTRSLGRFRGGKKTGALEARKVDEPAPADTKPDEPAADSKAEDAPKTDEAKPDDAKTDEAKTDEVKPDGDSPATSASTTDETAADKPASETAGDAPSGEAPSGDETGTASDDAGDSEGGPIRRSKKRK